MANNSFGTFQNNWDVQKLKKVSLRILAGIVLLVILLGTFFQIETEEVGIIVRLGKYTRTIEPGLHAKVPLIDKVFKVPVERQQKMEFGFRTEKAGVRSTYSEEDFIEESLMLTGDLNLADVEWVVQYRIDNPYNYLFKVRNPETTLRDIAESGMRQVVGDRTVNEVLTVGRAEIANSVKEKMQALCAEYSMGVTIDQIVLQDVNPPDAVKAAFNAVNEAQQEKETLINQAKSAYNKVIPKASGQAKETIEQARGYATERVNRAQGEVARFNALYLEYAKAPEVTKRRIYLETMQDVLPRLGQKVITDERGSNLLPLLQIQTDKKETKP
jgi:modulator of FtsH protease HflK